MDSTSFVIYPELEATEVRFSALKLYLCSFYFRIDNETGRIDTDTIDFADAEYKIECITLTEFSFYFEPMLKPSIPEARAGFLKHFFA